MKLYQALKEKARIIGDMKSIQLKIQMNNQIIEGNERDYKPRDLYLEFQKKREELITLKTAIIKSNQEIYPKVYKLEETKKELSLWTNMPCQKGKSRMYDGEVVYESEYTRQEIDATIKELNNIIRDLQDEIDIYNHEKDI